MSPSPHPRRLASRQLRALLWIRADGKCEICGDALPHNWHADHRIAWSTRPETYVADMLALCPPCNLRKGAMNLRKHQSEVLDICRDMAVSRSGRQLLVSVTPGGGKSLLPVIAASTLIPSVVDAICWVAPRATLCYQAEQTFKDRKYRRLLNHQHEIRWMKEQTADPSRGLSGFATTFNMIGHDTYGLLAQEFRRRRYVLVLDEAHHVAVGSKWHTALQPLVDRAAVVILMSGTFERSVRGERVAFVPYREVVKANARGWEIDLDGTGDNWERVAYSRRDALREQAIKPLVFEHADGRVQYLDGDGHRVAVDSLANSGFDERPALRVALTTEFGIELMRKGINHWHQYRTGTNPRAKLLVVAGDKKQARALLATLKADGIERAGIAISSDGTGNDRPTTENEEAQSHQNIQRFKMAEGENRLDVLVTVAMAYEGLDVPAVTHIVCLTYYRSKPWIEQMLARAVRVDAEAGPYGVQSGFVFAPDDEKLSEVIQDILNDQAAFVPEVTSWEADDPRRNQTSGDRDTPWPIIPEFSTVTTTRLSDTDGNQMDAAQTKWMREQLEAHNLGGINPLQARMIVELFGTSSGVRPPDDVEAIVIEAPGMTESDLEDRYRTYIHEAAGKLDARRGVPWGTTNGEILKRFQKPRGEMGSDELRQVWVVIQQWGREHGRAIRERVA